MEQQSANNGRCCQMEKSGQLHAQGQQGLWSQPAAVWEKEFHEKMRDLKGMFSLKPCIADYNYISYVYAWNAWGYVLQA